MAVTETALAHAESRALDEREDEHVLSARYDRHSARVTLRMNPGIEVTFPTAQVGGLTGAAQENLADIEISPTGLGLHWPRLDADLHVPALLQGEFGSRNSVAAQMGTAGGKARTPAKKAAARANGRKGGHLATLRPAADSTCTRRRADAEQGKHDSMAVRWLRQRERPSAWDLFCLRISRRAQESTAREFLFNNGSILEILENGPDTEYRALSAWID